MRKTLHRVGRLLAVLVIGASVASAEEPGFGAQFKMRAGLSPKAEDHLANYQLGFGLNFSYVSGVGTFGAELGYQYKAGQQWLESFGAPAAGQAAVDPTQSADSRKNSLDGLALRLSYGNGTSVDGLSWQAGLQVANNRFQHTYVGNVSDAGNTYPGGGNYGLQTYFGTPTKSQVSVNPFVGLTYRVSPATSFELNVISVRYTAINFTHTPGSALIGGDITRPGSSLVYAGDALQETKRNQIQVEFGYAFHF